MEHGGHSASVSDMAAIDEKLLSVSADATICMHDISVDKHLATELQRVQKAHEFNITSVKWAADGGLFTTASVDKSIKVWDA